MPPCHGGGAVTWLPARPQTGVRAWWAVPSAQLGGGRLESSVSFALSSSVSHRWGNCEVADHGRRPTFGVGSSFSRAMILGLGLGLGLGVRVRVRVRG